MEKYNTNIKIAIKDICIKNIDSVKTNQIGLIDYIDIASVDNKSKTISSFKTIDIKDAPSRAKQLIKKNDILVSTVRPNLNAVAINNLIPSNIQVCSTGFCVLRPKEYVLPSYLFNFCKSDLFINEISQQATGASYPAVTSRIIKNCQIPLPSLSEQKRIADILDKATELIALRKQQLEKLDLLVKSRFIEMFGTFPLNEKKWKTGNIREVITEARYGSSRPAVDGGRYPYLRMNNITYSGELDLTDIKYIDIPDNELVRCAVSRGDVLFNRTNSKELVGKTCVYDRDEMMILAGFVIRVRVNELVLPDFLSAFLNTDFSKQMLQKMCKVAIGQANINAKELQDIALYIPPVETQKDFVVFKQQVSELKYTLQQSLEKLELNYKALMQTYFG